LSVQFVLAVTQRENRNLYIKNHNERVY
jgi:hypothetical protein